VLAPQRRSTLTWKDPRKNRLANVSSKSLVMFLYVDHKDLAQDRHLPNLQHTPQCDTDVTNRKEPQRVVVNNAVVFLG
jgi:hypothetical protein